LTKHKNYFELIQNTFSTIILDSIQYFPENIKKVHYESSGLLFGIEKGDFMECDYVFPVGSVEKRAKDSITTNPKVELALKTSRELFSTSQFLGSYHSHPYEDYFPEWARPSNGDVRYSLNTKYPFEIIIAITRDGKEDKPLTFNLYENDGFEFFYDKTAGGHSFPIMKELGYKTSFIAGEFKRYQFEIRLYQFSGTSLRDIDLESSEAELLLMLDEEEIKLSTLRKADTYRLRKMEFNLRTEQNDPKSDENIKYHLKKLRQNEILK
jgi:proteasome lid subunit RPN8/RPN11